MEHGRIVRFIHRLPLAERTLKPADGLGPLANAIRAMHSMGVIHGDVKPDNVLIMPDGSLKLADFSISNRAQGVLADMALGTERWQSPEQARGEACTSKSDVWAFGMIYLWANGTNDREAIQEMLHHEPDKRWTMTKICEVYYPCESVTAPATEPLKTALLKGSKWLQIVQDFIWHNKWHDSHEFQAAIYHVLVMSDFQLLI
jgi:serine/threonine protein kinase